MTSTHARRGRWAIALTLLGALALAGCTAGEQEETPTTSSATATNVNGLPDGVQQATEVPTEVANTPALRANVQVSACEAADGGWSASGTARNPGDADTAYTITIFFTTDGGTVIGTGETKVDVAAGESEDWTVTAQLTPAPTTLCVLRGVG
ncbi:hypothetical protein AAIB33_17830 [Microbacterium sp. AZCO]|uniref:hypothetical protein n=1 Tax=Microbacterium sp. AZCO TaxID=3142976 RepID=UPI0031F3DBAF